MSLKPNHSKMGASFLLEVHCIWNVIHQQYVLYVKLYSKKKNTPVKQWKERSCMNHSLSKGLHCYSFLFTFCKMMYTCEAKLLRSDFWEMLGFISFLLSSRCVNDPCSCQPWGLLFVIEMHYLSALGAWEHRRWRSMRHMGTPIMGNSYGLWRDISSNGIPIFLNTIFWCFGPQYFDVSECL